MDPLSQGVVGMSAAQSVAKQKQLMVASLIGFLSGMAADLDIFIRSPTDPLLFLEFHRQFTHSLIFIPIGGFICAICFYGIMALRQKKGLSFKQTYLFATLGYATHALLDSCTSYGTQLFWPFSSERIAWNNVSIIDPLFTLPLLLLVMIAAVKRSKKWGYIGSIYGLCYLSLGFVQEHRAYQAAYELALTRGHTPAQLSVKPSFANLIVWKSIYSYQGQYYIDGVRVAEQTSYFPGTTVKKLVLPEDLPWLMPHTQQAIDLERFRWFSSDHLALDSRNPNRIIDMRYSMLPNTIDGLWGIVLSPTATESDHIQWVTNRDVNQRKHSLFTLWQMIKGQHAQTLSSITDHAIR